MSGFVMPYSYNIDMPIERYTQMRIDEMMERIDGDKTGIMVFYFPHDDVLMECMIREGTYNVSRTHYLRGICSDAVVMYGDLISKARADEASCYVYSVMKWFPASEIEERKIKDSEIPFCDFEDIFKMDEEEESV